MMWTLEEALELVRTLQPHAMRAGYYLALAGGVLNKGHSDKDLDLVAVPMTSHSCSASLVVLSLFMEFELACVAGVPGGLWVQYRYQQDKIVELVIMGCYATPTPTAQKKVPAAWYQKGQTLPPA